MTTTLLRIGANAAAREPPARVEHRRRERDDAVEEHLRHEQPQQGRSRAPAALRRSRPLDVERCRGRTIHGAASTPTTVIASEREHRDGEDRRRCVVVARLEVLHEQRHQRRGEHAAEQELVDDVGRLVGVAVRAGERGHAQRVGDGRDPHEAGDAGERGADRDDRARPDDCALRSHLELRSFERRRVELRRLELGIAPPWLRFRHGAGLRPARGRLHAAHRRVCGASGGGGCPNPTRARGTRARRR